MQNTTEIIKAFLEENKYRVTEVDDDGIITLMYEMNTIYINPDCNGRNFVSVILPGISDVDEDNPTPALIACSKVSETQMVTKAFIAGSNVNVSYEFNFLDEADLLYNIDKSFEALIYTKIYFQRIRRQMEKE